MASTSNSVSARLLAAAGLLLLGLAPTADADDDLARGRDAVRSMAGCFLVDYSYVEIGEPPARLRPGRPRLRRQPRQVRQGVDHRRGAVDRDDLCSQRVLFATDLGGAVRAGSEIKHQSEDWEYDAPFLYDFVAPRTLAGEAPARARRAVDAAGHQPRRRAPLPVRGALDDRHRLSRVVVLELRADSRPRDARHGPRGLQHARPHHAHRRLRRRAGSSARRTSRPSTATAAAARSPARSGKNWYVRLPDVRVRDRPGVRAAAPGLLGPPARDLGRRARPAPARSSRRRRPATPPRFVKMHEVEDDYVGRDLADPAVRTRRPGAHPEGHRGVSRPVTRPRIARAARTAGGTLQAVHAEEDEMEPALRTRVGSRLSIAVAVAGLVAACVAAGPAERTPRERAVNFAVEGVVGAVDDGDTLTVVAANDVRFGVRLSESMRRSSSIAGAPIAAARAACSPTGRDSRRGARRAKRSRRSRWESPRAQSATRSTVSGAPCATSSSAR